jgi:tRNA(Arg) A34 adenosine deaminase TadA
MRARHERFLRKTLILAAKAREKGNHPFGALLVHNGKIVLEAENSVATDHDQTSHAELNLLRKACPSFDTQEMGEMTLYSSTEPCAMCAAAMFWAGIRHVVYAWPTQALAELTTGSFVVPCRDLFSHAKPAVKVEGPFLIVEARKVHLGFWKPRLQRDASRTMTARRWARYGARARESISVRKDGTRNRQMLARLRRPRFAPYGMRGRPK